MDPKSARFGHAAQTLSNDDRSVCEPSTGATASIERRSLGRLDRRLSDHPHTRANVGGEAVPDRARKMRASISDVAEDLEAWVNEGYEGL